MRILVEKRCSVCKGRGYVESKTWGTYVKVGDTIRCQTCDGRRVEQAAITLKELRAALAKLDAVRGGK